MRVIIQAGPCDSSRSDQLKACHLHELTSGSSLQMAATVEIWWGGMNKKNYTFKLFTYIKNKFSKDKYQHKLSVRFLRASSTLRQTVSSL